MDESLFLVAQAAGFLWVLWLAGFIFRRMNLSSLVAEIIVGVAMGPGGLDIVPKADGFALLGKLGIFWLMFDGGAHLDVGLLRESGLRAFLVALTGLVVPLAMVWVVMVIFGFTALQAFVMGTALAPTSAGMTVKLMADAGVLDTKIGQMIVCSAMTDDVLSLIILAVVSNLSVAGDLADLSFSTKMALDISLPLLSSAAFIVVAGVIARFMPRIISGHATHIVAPVMVAWSVALALGCSFGRSSEYMGVFLAGVSFAKVYVDAGSAAESSDEESKAEESTSGLQRVPVWLEQESTMILQAWLVSVFFASSGFYVQVQVLLNPDTLMLGLLCAVVAMVGKLVSGLYCPGYRLCVGLAMASRGELGLVMAAQALELGLTPEKAFNVTVWGVLLNTLIAPPLFQMVLKRASQEQQVEEADSAEVAGGAAGGGGGTGISDAAASPPNTGFDAAESPCPEVHV